jgi:hypothetical protein
MERGAALDVHSAARLGMFDKVREFITANPAVVNARGANGQSVLHFATTIEIADFLLNHGADIELFYYTKTYTTAGIWRMPLYGGDEEQVGGLNPVLQHRYWEMADLGIYFVDSTGSPQLRFFDFATNQPKSGSCSAIGRLK